MKCLSVLFRSLNDSVTQVSRKYHCAIKTALLSVILEVMLVGLAHGGGYQNFSTVSPSRVEAGSFYTGATIHVHGIVNPKSAVIVRLMGSIQPQVFNRKERVWYIWGDVEHIIFQNAPSCYILLASGTLQAVAGPQTRKKYLLGIPALIKQIRLVPKRPAVERLVYDFVHLKEREHLYLVESGGVELSDIRQGRREFEAYLDIPPNMPPGRLELEVLEFRDEHHINRDVHEIQIERVGMPGFLGSFANQRPALFGFVSLLAMILMGLVMSLAGLSMRKDETSSAAVIAKASFFRLLKSLRVKFFQPGEEQVAYMRAKFREFQTLLSLNNEVLGLLAELEEESSWTSFRHARVRMAIRALMDSAMDMVRTLNRLADNHYFDLETVVVSIRKEVTGFLDNLPKTEKSHLTLPLSDVRTSDAVQIGGKSLNLARLQYDLKLSVPDSFVVTTEAYRQFLESGGLSDRLRAILTPARLDNIEDLASRSKQAIAFIEESPIPHSVEQAILEAVNALNLEPGEGLAARSSAVGEDSTLSYAGQFESMLNVRPQDLPSAWKSVVASRYLARAIFYRRATGVAEVDAPMAVLVQRMIRPRASGVLFTRRPDRPKEAVLLISSAWGVGRDVSIGSADADEWVLSRRRPFEVLERRVPPKYSCLNSSSSGGIETIPLPEKEQSVASLSDEQLFALADIGLSIENYFGGAVDIEWAFNDQDQIVILQARPLRTERVKNTGAPPPADAKVILEGGKPVWAGRAVGPIWRVDHAAELSKVPEGSILVLNNPLVDVVGVIPRVCGVIVEHGSVTGHLASVLREFHVPSLFGLPCAMSQLEPGQLVSLDVAHMRIYEGALWPELRGQIAFSLTGRGSSGLPETLAERLTHLTGSMLMTTWTCRSLHDVVRFSHEMAIQSMFGLGGELSRAKTGGVKKLENAARYTMDLIDLGGGLVPGVEDAQKVTLEQVSSIPFKALWIGLIDERFSVEKLSVEGAGSLGRVVMNTALRGAGERALGEPSYVCLTSSYLNLNSRQAYHFAIVDAYVSDNQNSNHLSFRLKGGGAAEWQRVLRVQCMAEILRSHHFTVSERGDLLNAWLRGLDIPNSEKKLVMIGRLLHFCGQLDMWMNRPQIVQSYVEKFLEAETQTIK